MMKNPNFLFGAAAIALVAAAPVAEAQQAQGAALDKRVERLEKEMRAVQRSVFPGGSPAFFEGEIAPDSNAASNGAKPNAPVIELTARVDALEAQLQTLTGQTEQNAFQLRELEKQFAAYKAEMEKRLAPPEAAETPAALPLVATSGASAPVPTPVSAVVKTPAPAPAAAPAATKPAATKPAPAKPAAKPDTAKPDPARLALVKKIEIPVTGNEAQDGYDYGYRLWQAKLYPEAQVQLKQVVDKWPSNRVASYAQNLLGRAYLDDGKPSLAALAFYDNYKDRPDGARAPHSLMYMGVALDRLGRKKDACDAFREFDQVYGTKAPKDVRDDATAAKAKAGC